MAAHTREQLEVLKAEITAQECYLVAAEKREEALHHAISAAEAAMKALKISMDKSERADLRGKCKIFLERAELIKAADRWPPLKPANSATNEPVSSSFEPTKGLAKSDNAELAPHVFSKQLTIGKRNSIQTSGGFVPDAPSHSAGLPISTPPTFSNSEDTKPWPSYMENHFSGSPVTDALAYPLTKDGSNMPAGSQSPVLHSVCSIAASVGPSYPEKTSESLVEVKVLKEPVSTRYLSKKEQIILLKASKVNGFVFPPWKEAPNPSEFSLPDEAEPFCDAAELKLSSHQMDHFLCWARAKDALPPPSWFSGERLGLLPVMRASRSVDLVQDAATDCSVVASLCAGIARTERGHDSVFCQKLWPYDTTNKQPEISPSGKYIVRLNFNGCWRKVVIDDRLPLSKTNRTLHVVDRRNSGLLWPALLEKAYLKVRGGYDFPGSNSCSDLWALTGWIPEQIYLQEGDLVPSQLWSRLYTAFLYGDVLVTLGTGKMSHRAERELGLEGQHSYVILDMKETDHEKAFLVKNPWLEGKGWRGRRPSANFLIEESSSSGTLSLNDGIKPNPKHNPYPSTFWIGIDSVVQHFESLYLNWNTGLFSHRQDIHFSWDLATCPSAPGCIADHPQFSFKSDGGGIVWLVLSRHFRDTPSGVHNQSDAFNDGTVRSDLENSTDDDPLKGYMNIHIYDRHGVRVLIKDNYIERGQYVNTPQSLLRWECQPNSTYTVVIDQEELLASLYTFTLSAFSSSTMVLEQAYKKYAYEKRVFGSWTSETAGGNTHSPKYFDNPQYSLAIGAHTPLAILIQTREGQYPVHVKLVHGHGKRIHNIQSRDILTDSGEHRDGCALAEVHDVPPGKYTIICSMFETAKAEDFSLTVYAVTGCDVRPIPKDGAGLVPTKLANAWFSSSVNKVAAPIVPRRISAITVVVKFLCARTPSAGMAPGRDVKTRSPLRISIEMGRGPQKALIASSESGEFSDAATVRTQCVDLRPNMLYDGDMWLVLERLSSPGNAIEEWYDVEMFADAPQAFSAGLWRGWDD